MREGSRMGQTALFIGWGTPVRGRELKGLEVFDESLAYWRQLRQEGRIEDFQVVLLYPHGSDLEGFVLLHGTAAQLNGLDGDEEFLRLTIMQGLVSESFRVIPASLGAGLDEQVRMYREMIARLDRERDEERIRVYPGVE
jgi:hypothetical protein